MKTTTIKKTTIALALLSVTGAASAQVQIYGRADTGILIETNARVQPTNPNDVPGNTRTVVRMPSLTAGAPSALGFRGREDLGDGASAFFMLESQIGMDDGSLQSPGGRLFSRAALVGLAKGPHTVTLGRQYNMTAYAILDAMLIGPGLHSIASLNGYLGTARSDNAIGYSYKADGLTLGATYSLGRDSGTNLPNVPSATNCPGEVPGNSKACRQVTAMAKYDTPAYGVAVAFDQSQGNAGAFDPNQPFGGAGNGLLGAFTSADQKVELKIVDGYYHLGATMLSAGTVQRKTSAAGVFKTGQYWVGARRDLSDSVRGYAVFTWLNSSANMDANTRLAILRGEYRLSKRTYLYASYAHVANRGANARSAASAGFSTVNGATQDSLLLGIDHTF